MKSGRSLRGHRDGVPRPASFRLDLRLALENLNREMGIGRLELNGGGGANGSLLRPVLVDEISRAIFPAVDGAKGAPSVFDSDAMRLAHPLRSMTLESSQVLEGGAANFLDNSTNCP